MKLKGLCSALLCVLLLNSVNIPASALSQENTNIIPANSVVEISNLEFVSTYSARATNRLNWSIASSVTKKSSTTLDLDVNETVTFNCSFTPSSSNVYFGLIASDGNFHCSAATNGRFKGTIKVPKTDKYYLAIYNNSGSTIQVTGTVSY